MLYHIITVNGNSLVYVGFLLELFLRFLVTTEGFSHLFIVDFIFDLLYQFIKSLLMLTLDFSKGNTRASFAMAQFAECGRIPNNSKWYIFRVA